MNKAAKKKRSSIGKARFHKKRILVLPEVIIDEEDFRIYAEEGMDAALLKYDEKKAKSLQNPPRSKSSSLPTFFKYWG